MAGLTEEMFDLNRLQRYVGATIYERGRLYYQQGRVSIDYVEEDYATCIVSGQGGVSIEIISSFSVIVHMPKRGGYVSILWRRSWLCENIYALINQYNGKRSFRA
jgi:hypothetical protein